MEEGHYQEDTPKSIVEEKSNFQPASEVEESRALRFDQVSFRIRPSEKTESQKASVGVELEDGKRIGNSVPETGSRILSSCVFHGCSLWRAFFADLGDILECTTLLYWTHSSWPRSV